ncbi:hypothetical protein F2Q70_00022606 [Brassica cretica]|uniref:Uncharacterized protein n=1 Tax=Brassica cretica TaxID=69181 RepID=A0A8S9GQN5_BRACR|nr:hypothetical protein F2Q70_00022606 [Brassica cretica]
MGHMHLYVSLALRHITKREKRTSSRFEVPHQMSNTIWIFRNRTILGMRELPMKRLSNNRFTRDTKTMVRTIRFSLLRRTITPLRIRWATRLNTRNRVFTLGIFGPLELHRCVRFLAMYGDLPTVRLTPYFGTRYSFELAFQCHRFEVNQHPVAEVMPVLLKYGQSASREKTVEKRNVCRSMQNS